MNKLIFSAAVVLGLTSAFGELKLATPFTDGVILQRQMNVPVWGTADAGATVAVSFAGQTVSAVADASGAWKAVLAPLAASKEPWVMSVSAGDEKVSVGDVLVGEVWLASGQSNMECPIWGAEARYRDGAGALMTRLSRHDDIRFVKNARHESVTADLSLRAVWKKMTPASFPATDKLGDLSAVAFYYALELHHELDVPIAIIDSSWGGTRIEPWTPPTGKLYNGMVAAYAPFAMRGMIWYQGCANAREADQYEMRLKNLYKGLSAAFENPSFEMYLVQLAPWSSSWFDLQLAQARFASGEPHAAYVTTGDLGNAWDIHPNMKEPVARRLAQHAFRRVYGRTDLVSDPPEVKSCVAEGGAIKVSFTNATKWYVYNPDRSGPIGFEVAGKDGVFKPAEVKDSFGGASFNGFVEGDALTIASKEVAEPVHVRYLHEKPWRASLYALDSTLPLGPFRASVAGAEPVQLAYKPGAAFKDPVLKDFRVLYTSNLPASGRGRYATDKSATVGAFTRVAYVFELTSPAGETQWVVTAVDAPTTDVKALGLPSASRKTLQAKLAHLTVRSNVPGVQAVTDAEGGVIEFCNSNYSKPCAVDGIGGDANAYDFNDTLVGKEPGFGCMQVHNAAARQTLWAYNNFNASTPCDVGIGNNAHPSNPDWTRVGNGERYAIRRLTVMVK